MTDIFDEKARELLGGLADYPEKACCRKDDQRHLAAALRSVDAEAHWDEHMRSCGVCVFNPEPDLNRCARRDELERALKEESSD